MRRATFVALVAVLVAALCGIAANPGQAQERTVGAGVAVPAAPSDVTAAKAYQALERNCAGCHQAGRGDGRSGGRLDNILSLSEIARQPTYVRPGLPDASRLYNVALTRERHADLLNDPALPEPSALEVQDIRDWIAELKPQAACKVGARLDAAAAGRLMADALRGAEPETARVTRFLSLAHLGNSCAAATQFERLALDLARAPALSAGGQAAAFGARAGAPAFVALDSGRLLWRFALRDLGLSAADWEARIAAYPLRDAPGISIPPTVAAATGSALPLVAADWFLDAAAGAGVGPTSGWRTAGDAARLAAETWLAPDTLSERLRRMPPAAVLPARRLLAGDAVGRADLDLLSALLAGRQVSSVAEEAGPLEIALWSDRAVYKAGELASFSVTASDECHLTLVGIDRGGRAVVLFPSEFEPNNALARGRVLTIPAADAPYKFRFKEKGRETIVATCSKTHKAPPGVHHDYDRLRFTVLGDWKLFLREPTEMKDARRDDAATDTPRAYRVARMAAICDDSSEVSDIDRIATATITSSSVNPPTPAPARGRDVPGRAPLHSGSRSASLPDIYRLLRCCSLPR